MSKKISPLAYAVVGLLVAGLVLYFLFVRASDEGWKFVFALLTLVVAAIAAETGYQQRKITHAKLNLDLFQLRYGIFTTVWGYLSHVTQGGVPSYADPKSAELGNLVPQAEFLFGPDISDYMRTIQTKTTELHVIDLRTKANNDVLPQEMIENHTALLNWFFTEASSGAREKFGKYMNFEQWR
ncbi:hypothetical protein [Cupriavidus taiwanensis]|uniref:hypothetical protein n=1 Tax=Cupriavidus taiwanensis TaxID=164546 RepID=UPI000E15E3F7|nr:hypothetical protein [Cupriavidus taiwanensis]SPA46760.1 exported hypothetical protein [Cupriavidus taiwanensis]